MNLHPYDTQKKKRERKELLFLFYTFCRSSKIHWWIWGFFPPAESQFLTSWSSNDAIICHVFFPPIKNLEVLLLKASLSSTIKPSPCWAPGDWIFTPQGPPLQASPNLEMWIISELGFSGAAKWIGKCQTTWLTEGVTVRTRANELSCGHQCSLILSSTMRSQPAAHSPIYMASSERLILSLKVPGPWLRI